MYLLGNSPLLEDHLTNRNHLKGLQNKRIRCYQTQNTKCPPSSSPHDFVPLAALGLSRYCTSVKPSQQPARHISYAGSM